MVGTVGIPENLVDQVWDEWAKGQSFRKIARVVNRSPGQVKRFVNSYGGVRPRPVKRPRMHLSLADREEISRGLARGDSFRVIGAQINRPHSTISREVRRNGGRDGYRALVADRCADARRLRPKPAKLASCQRLRVVVEAWLGEDWSPEQISHRLRLEHPDDPDMWVSHEAIYLSIYQPARAALRRDCHRHLRSQRMIRHRRNRAGFKGSGRGQLRNITAISQRPAEVETRERLGDLEGDLVMGTRPSAVATLVDRRTRYLRIVAVDGIKARPVREALVDALTAIPADHRRSLTWDRGREMAEHELLATLTGTPIYFADAHSPWQRGTNENVNGLLRQYLPQRTNLATYSQAELNKIADRINNRPRKVLGWLTPAEVYAQDAHGALTA